MSARPYIVPEWFDDWFDGLFPITVRTYTARFIARRLGVDYKTIYNALNRGDIPSDRKEADTAFEPQILIKRDDLRTWCLASLELNREDYE